METKHCECDSVQIKRISDNGVCTTCGLSVPSITPEEMRSVMEKVDAQIGNAVRRLGSEGHAKCCEKCKNDYTKDPTAMMNGEFCLNKGECYCHIQEHDPVATMYDERMNAIADNLELSSKIPFYAEQPPTEKWEAEFDEIFGVKSKTKLVCIIRSYSSRGDGTQTHEVTSQVKSFIRSVRGQAIEEGFKDGVMDERERVRGVIESKRKCLWIENIYQHNRNIERENVLNDLLQALK